MTSAALGAKDSTSNASGKSAVNGARSSLSSKAHSLDPSVVSRKRWAIPSKRRRPRRERRSLTVESKKRHHKRKGAYYSVSRNLMKFVNASRQFLCCTPYSTPRYQGSINLDELIGEEVMFKTLQELIQEEWDKSDMDSNGMLNEKEVKTLLHRLNVGIPEKEIHHWITEYDKDGNGSLDFKEFQLMFQSLNSAPDLTDEFLRAKAMVEDSEAFQAFKAQLPSNAIRQLFLRVENLQWFFSWASGGQDHRSEAECVKMIHQYSPNKPHQSISSLSAAASRSRIRSSSDQRSPRYKSKRLLRVRSTKMTHTGSSQTLTDEFVDVQMSYDSFVLMIADSRKNLAADPAKTELVYQDMTLPLSQYFISSSHNSYLLGNQLNSESSPVAIIRALKLGVRVIELDAWDGSDGQPIVTHGHTLCKPTSFKECIEAIKEYGFVTSEYPCIITIENHCSMQQQQIQVDLMNLILGDALFKWKEAEDYDEDELRHTVGPQAWLSPEDLKMKFVVRDRPLKRMTKSERKTLLDRSSDRLIPLSTSSRRKRDSTTKGTFRDSLIGGLGLDQVTKVFSLTRSREEEVSEEKESLIKDVEQAEISSMPSATTDVTMMPESCSDEEWSEDDSAGNEGEDKFKEMEEVDDLAQLDGDVDGVCGPLLRLMYIKNIEPPIEKDPETSQLRFLEPPFLSSSSLVEQKMRELAKPGSSAAALCTYSKNHLLRVFPSGARITSSNYDPVPAWNCGCQIVALNYQSFGRKVWLNQGKFTDNGGCGFVLKPQAMREAIPTGVRGYRVPSLPGGPQEEKVSSKAKKLFGAKSVYMQGTRTLPWDLSLTFFEERMLKVHILSGHYLPKTVSRSSTKSTKTSIINPYVEMSLRDLDGKRLVKQTSWVENNGFNPRWNESFEFPLHFAELALLSFVIRSTDGVGFGGTGGGGDAFVAQNVIPVHLIRPGYRIVPLLYANGAHIDKAYIICRFMLT